MAQIYVSIGSNIKRELHIPAAISALKQYYQPLTISTIYETEAVGFSGDDFYNCVVGFETEQSFTEVETILDQIEHEQGRTRAQQKFAARTLDLDLLLYDDLVLYDQGFNVPRDEIMKYAFVLQPLAEIAGNIQHPINGQTMADLWNAFESGEKPLKPVSLQFD